MSDTQDQMLDDLSLLISDVEKVSVQNPKQLDLKRAIGQLKAAKSSLLKSLAAEREKE